MAQVPAAGRGLLAKYYRVVGLRGGRVSVFFFAFCFACGTVGEVRPVRSEVALALDRAVECKRGTMMSGNEVAGKPAPRNA